MIVRDSVWLTDMFMPLRRDLRELEEVLADPVEHTTVSFSE